VLIPGKLYVVPDKSIAYMVIDNKIYYYPDFFELKNNEPIMFIKQIDVPFYKDPPFREKRATKQRPMLMFSYKDKTILLNEESIYLIFKLIS
jgi:hypothetical protein